MDAIIGPGDVDVSRFSDVVGGASRRALGNVLYFCLDFGAISRA
jgi:hypothetical protein